uniref:Uncharacterized protein n=1 Tax=Rhizophora mucronata TaxID=61149 RepID=A0A2P2IK42_RHIMU
MQTSCPYISDIKGSILVCYTFSFFSFPDFSKYGGYRLSLSRCLEWLPITKTSYGNDNSFFNG